MPRGPHELDPRSAAVLREIVEQYVETGEPVGSRTLSRRLPISLSPATIRNVMSDLTEAGLLFSPHTSAGRLPTERGLRLFVDGLLQFGSVPEEEQEAIGRALDAKGRSLEDTLAETSALLAGLAGAAGLVLAPKSEGALRHIEFVALGSGRALVILVGADGQVENRVIETPPGLPPSALTQAANYLNARLSGRSLAELRRTVAGDMAEDRTQLDALTTQVVETGLATWSGEGRGGSLIVRGQARLLADVTAVESLQAIQTLFERLETQETMLRLLELAEVFGRRADLHRRRERAVRRKRGVDGGGAGAECGPDRRRHRGDRADADQLWADYPRRRLHGASDRPAAWLRQFCITSLGRARGPATGR